MTRCVPLHVFVESRGDDPRQLLARAGKNDLAPVKFQQSVRFVSGDIGVGVGPPVLAAPMPPAKRGKISLARAHQTFNDFASKFVFAGERQPFRYGRFARLDRARPGAGFCDVLDITFRRSADRGRA